MLNRIAEALKQKMTVVMTAKDPEATELRHAFQLLVQMLRRRHGFSVDALARRVEVDREEILAMERNPAYRPSPLTLHELCRFYEIPERRMLVLAGAIKEAPQGFSESASRFAAQSESSATLTDEEERALEEFLPVLKQAD